jgi:hypothetical protein
VVALSDTESRGTVDGLQEGDENELLVYEDDERYGGIFTPRIARQWLDPRLSVTTSIVPGFSTVDVNACWRLQSSYSVL